ncbi:MAG TPA: hypothetical protein V6C86_00225 [Oculatellaceae cyanobacterium]
MNLLLLRIGFWIIALAIASFQAWSGRYQLFGGDSLSYLDMADFIALGKFQDALSSYWSPAFPALIAIFIVITKAKVNAYFALMKVVGLFVFCLLLVAQEIFLASACRSYFSSENQSSTDSLQPLQPIVFRLCCYAAFLWCFLVLGGVYQDTPDQLLALFLIVSCTLFIEIQRARVKTLKSIFFLGLTLGAAFMTKAVALPFALLIGFFCLCLLRTWISRLKSAAVFCLGFAIVAAPYTISVFSTSRTSTVTTAMMLNYHWCVEWSTGPEVALGNMTSVDVGDLKRTFESSAKHRPNNATIASVSALPAAQKVEARMVGQSLWTIEDPLGRVTYTSNFADRLQHPADKLIDHPRTYYFGRPVPGTYPLWFDPGYWCDGIDIKFLPTNTLIVATANWLYYLAHFFSLILFSWMSLAIVQRSMSVRFAMLKRFLPIMLVSMLGFALYSVVVNMPSEHPGPQRYFSAFVYLLFCSYLGCLGIRPGRKGLIASVCMTVIVVVGCSAAVRRQIRQDVRRVRVENQESQKISSALLRAGLQPGDEVAFLGIEGQPCMLLPWAKLAGLRVTASIVEPSIYWSSTDQQRYEVHQALKKRGIKALVCCFVAPPELLSNGQVFRPVVVPTALFDSRKGWRQEGSPDCYLLLL